MPTRPAPLLGEVVAHVQLDGRLEVVARVNPLDDGVARVPGDEQHFALAVGRGHGGHAAQLGGAQRAAGVRRVFPFLDRHPLPAGVRAVHAAEQAVVFHGTLLELAHVLLGRPVGDADILHAVGFGGAEEMADQIIEFRFRVPRDQPRLRRIINAPEDPSARRAGKDVMHAGHAVHMIPDAADIS